MMVREKEKRECGIKKKCVKKKERKRKIDLKKKKKRQKNIKMN